MEVEKCVGWGEHGRTDRYPAAGGPASTQAAHDEGFCEAKDEEETRAFGRTGQSHEAVPGACLYSNAYSNADDFQ